MGDCPMALPGSAGTNTWKIYNAFFGRPALYLQFSQFPTPNGAIAFFRFEGRSKPEGLHPAAKTLSSLNRRSVPQERDSLSCVILRSYLSRRIPVPFAVYIHINTTALNTELPAFFFCDRGTASQSSDSCSLVHLRTLHSIEGGEVET